MNCAAWAISYATNEPIEIIDTLLRRYKKQGWVRVADDKIIGIRMPEAIIALAPYIGFSAVVCEGYGLTAAQWAETSLEPPDAPILLLSTDRHSMIAQGGKIFDVDEPDGLPAAEHSAGREIIRRAIRLWPGKE